MHRLIAWMERVDGLPHDSCPTQHHSFLVLSLIFDLDLWFFLIEIYMQQANKENDNMQTLSEEEEGVVVAGRGRARHEEEKNENGGIVNAFFR